MNESDTLATWSEELWELHAELQSAEKRRADLERQLRAAEMQTAILRTREQELTHDIERKRWVPVAQQAG
jgi:predicted  nucleic acid-binding Zn-ribbon protein